MHAGVTTIASIESASIEGQSGGITTAFRQHLLQLTRIALIQIENTAITLSNSESTVSVIYPLEVITK